VQVDGPERAVVAEASGRGCTLVALAKGDMGFRAHVEPHEFTLQAGPRTDHVEVLTNTVTTSWLTADGAALGRDSKVGDEVTSRSGEIVLRHEFPTGERIGLR
jgi:hypothetical protein